MKNIVLMLSAIGLIVGLNVAIAAEGDIFSVGPADEFRVTSAGVAVVTEVSGVVRPTISTATVTNGATLTLSAGVNVVTPIGGANDTTNTVTIAALTAADVGNEYEIIVASTATNLLKIATGGNMRLGSDWIGDTNDVLVVRSVVANELIAVGKEDN